MRKTQKKQAEIFLQTASQAHHVLRLLIEKKKREAACMILEDCQQGMIQLGSMIEQSEGEGFVTIQILEQYCETVYQIYEQLQSQEAVSADKVFKILRKELLRIESSVKNDIPIKYEIVFLPYKASMWDSLESVWMAADADENCDAYVVPIPYYDKKPDGSFGTRHYEGNEFPDGVPVMHYDLYNLEERRPDAVYIHNPYDDCNYVTSVAPKYYSDQLKKYTDCLVYIPYYATSGGMSEGQASCPAYYHADYIVIQAEKYRKFFDPALPKDKLVPLGSPKFDRVIRVCENPPAPPENWKKKLKDRKVYFYNTSIDGMLKNTEDFLKKMEYVFRCFEGRQDICLVWRPHPLLESTFDSMRKGFRPFYDKMKKHFLESGIGIYDDTPDITNTIAFCDAYIGDAGSSVTSLFGIAGKPMFILNNCINSEPEQDDWRGEIIRWQVLPNGYDGSNGYHAWMITQGNKLYHSPDHDYNYQYYCDLSEYVYGDYYWHVWEIEGKAYICPVNAQNILVAAHGRVEKCIHLERCTEGIKAFKSAWNIGNYLFLVPNQYPAVVRYDVRSETIDYIRDYNSVVSGSVQEKWQVGGSCIWNGYLLIASLTDSHVIAIEVETMRVQCLTTGAKNKCGCFYMETDGKEVWLLPYSGMTVTRWNPITGEVWEYSEWPDGFHCKNMSYGYKCEDRPFRSAAFDGQTVYLSPGLGNMFLAIDKESGACREWKPPFDLLERGKNGYYNPVVSKIAFCYKTDTFGEGTYRIFSITDHRLYDVNLKTKAYKEIEIQFDEEDLYKQEPGFCKISEWMQYGCKENVFNSLKHFLDGDIAGNGFNKKEQMEAYGQIAANSNGTCGQKIHQFVSGEI